MWKRLQQNKPGRPQSNEDTLKESIPFDHAYGASQSGMTDGERSQAGTSQPVRPARPPGEPLKGLPPLPFKPVQPHPEESKTRPASSIYSQYSPRLQQTRLPRMDTVARKYGKEVEISPPSSPETFTVEASQLRSVQGNSVTPDISPVDEMPDVSKIELGQQTSRPGSRAAGTNIPVLRREKRRNQVAAAAANLVPRNDGSNEGGVKNKKSDDTRWDALTGEPTTSERGRPPQVKPGQFTPPGNSIYETAVDRGLGLMTTASGAPKNQNSFGERIRKLRENNIMMGNRPEWKGSSGRTTLVPPVTDQLDRPPLSIPRKSSKRATSPRPVTGSGASTPLSTVLSGGAETPMVSPKTVRHTDPTVRPIMPSQAGQADQQSFTSSAPLSSGSSTPTQRYISPTFSDHQNPDQQFTSINDQENRRPPTNHSDTNQPDRKNSITSIERNFREALKDINFPPASREQPVSRFSVTTYATTTADSTPRVSTDSPPPMPSPPQQLTPIVNRHRGKVGLGIDSSKATTRKAVPGSPVFISMSSSTSRRNSKMLPKSPPETQSVDLCSSLQARLDDLANRRQNLQMSIRQMTELMPTDVLARGMEARRQAEEKKKVEILREDLADVIREEHDLGLRLHRAWKRRDQNAVYEPTGLWVRRVTG